MDFKTNHNCAKIVIDNKEYTVTLYLSTNDVCSVLDFSSEDKNDYKYAVATIIENHIVPTQIQNSLVESIALNDTILYKFIYELLCEEEGIKKHYEKYENESDFCKRFINAINDEWESIAEKTSKAIADTLKDKISSINSIHSVFVNNLNQLANVVKTAIESYANISETIVKSIVAINQKLSSVLSQIKIPQLSEEKKAEICQSYEKWGKFGWSILPNAPIKLYYTSPDTQKEANEIAMSYCSKSDMLDLFESTKKLKGCKKKDFEEAIFDFQNKKYKSCAMILFSLIDAKLIRMQRKEDIKKGKKFRETGLSAAKIIEKRIENEHDINQKLTLLLFHKNLFTCISTFLQTAMTLKFNLR